MAAEKVGLAYADPLFQGRYFTVRYGKVRLRLSAGTGINIRDAVIDSVELSLHSPAQISNSNLTKRAESCGARSSCPVSKRAGPSGVRVPLGAFRARARHYD